MSSSEESKDEKKRFSLQEVDEKIFRFPSSRVLGIPTEKYKSKNLSEE